MGAAAHIFIGVKCAPKNGMNSQGFEIIRRDNASRHNLRAVANTERGPRNLAYKERVKQFAVPLKIEEIGPRKPGPVGLRRSRQGYQPFLMRYHRVEAKQKSFHPTENRGIRANTQSQAEDRQNSEPRTAAQHSQRKPKILEKSFEERQAARFSIGFFGLL